MSDVHKLQGASESGKIQNDGSKYTHLHTHLKLWLGSCNPWCRGTRFYKLSVEWLAVDLQSTYVCLLGFLVLPFALFCQQNTRKLLPRKNKSARVFFSNYESSIK